jgi:hypothetical protein
MPTFAGVTWSAQRIPTAIKLGFLYRSRYFFIQVAPQLSSRGWVDPVPDPLFLRKSGRAGNRNRTRNLWICSQKLWPLDHTGGLSQNKTICKIISYSVQINVMCRHATGRLLWGVLHRREQRKGHPGLYQASQWTGYQSYFVSGRSRAFSW